MNIDASNELQSDVSPADLVREGILSLMRGDIKTASRNFMGLLRKLDHKPEDALIAMRQRKAMDEMLTEVRKSLSGNMHFTSHVERIQNAMRIRDVLRPFAENPSGQKIGRHPCHDGICSHEECGRCSRAADAWHLLNEQNRIISEYASHAWVMVSDSNAFIGYEGQPVEYAAARRFDSEELCTPLPSGYSWASVAEMHPVFSNATNKSASSKP